MDSYVHTPLSLTCLIRHSIWTTHLDLDLFRRTDIDDFEMLLIEFKASELCMPASKLAELRKIQEGNCLKKSAANLNCWTSLPEAFICLKKVAIVLLSTFGSTYTCEQIFSHMKAVL